MEPFRRKANKPWGRSSMMPAHGEFLGEQRVHILAAYVYGLSQPEGKGIVKVKSAR